LLFYFPFPFPGVPGTGIRGFLGWVRLSAVVFFIHFLNRGMNSGWGVSYNIMAKMLLWDLLILSLISLIFAILYNEGTNAII